MNGIVQQQQCKLLDVSPGQFNIWRTYDKKRCSILGGAHNIHKEVFQEQKNVMFSPDNTRKNAILLTKFFRDYKEASKKKDALNVSMAKWLLEGSFKKIPRLDFKAEGLNFEKELDRLLNSARRSVNSKSSVVGEVQATTYLQVGRYNPNSSSEEIKKQLKKIIEDYLDDFAQEFENFLKNEDSNFVVDSNNMIYLKIGVNRNQKIDVMKSENRRLGMEITGTPSEDLANVINLLNTAKFSVKSYRTGSSVDFGDTDPKKAVAGVASAVGTPWSIAAALYYQKRPDPKDVNDHQSKNKISINTEIIDLYEHYGHMREVYEITGMGLRTSDLQELGMVDFVIVNRTHGTISVYSTADILSKFGHSKHLSLGRIFKQELI